SVTHTRQVIEQTPETTVVKKTVTEKQYVTETNRKMVPVYDKEAVHVNRKAEGAYVDTSSLVGGGAEAAKKERNWVGGGAAAFAPGAATYDSEAANRIFVEGAAVVREVPTTVTRVVPVVEMRREPYTTTRIVPIEVITKVPTNEVKVVPVTVEK